MKLFKRRQKEETNSSLLWRLKRLEEEVETLQHMARHAVPCTARYGPYANSLSNCKQCGWSISQHSMTYAGAR
jgi:hypothetical protein